jgi:uncharacterized protein (DUF1499 family)
VALFLSVGGVLVALLAALGSGQGILHVGIGLGITLLAWLATLVGGTIAITAMVLARRSRQTGLQVRNLVALIFALGFLLFFGNLVWTGKSVPAIHDATTNLADIPQFRRLEVRKDNWKNIPELPGSPKGKLTPQQRWRAIHAQAYADLRTVRVPWSAAETVERAKRLAIARGWEVVTVDPGNGMLEAVATSMFFRFKDNVVLRARDVPGGGAEVDMRSMSRIGGGDVGVNAKRIRSFLADLRAT